MNPNAKIMIVALVEVTARYRSHKRGEFWSVFFVVSIFAGLLLQMVGMPGWLTMALGFFPLPGCYPALSIFL